MIGGRAGSGCVFLQGWGSPTPDRCEILLVGEGGIGRHPARAASFPALTQVRQQPARYYCSRPRQRNTAREGSPGSTCSLATCCAIASR